MLNSFILQTGVHADLLQSQGEKSEKKSRKKSGKKLKGEKKVETEKIERKIWMALTGLRTFSHTYTPESVTPSANLEN